MSSSDGVHLRQDHMGVRIVDTIVSKHGAPPLETMRLLAFAMRLCQRTRTTEVPIAIFSVSERQLSTSLITWPNQE